MKPPWIEIDDQEAAERKARVLAKMEKERNDKRDTDTDQE